MKPKRFCKVDISKARLQEYSYNVNVHQEELTFSSIPADLIVLL